MTRSMNKYAHLHIKSPVQITLKRLKTMDLRQMQSVLARCWRWEPSPEVAAAEALILDEMEARRAWEALKEVRR